MIKWLSALAYLGPDFAEWPNDKVIVGKVGKTTSGFVTDKNIEDVTVAKERMTYDKYKIHFRANLSTEHVCILRCIVLLMFGK